jgi:pyruvate kinase
MSKNFDMEVESIIARLQPIRLEALKAEEHFREQLDYVYSGNLQSARNLVHYLSLRRHDIRELQEDLGRLALSSLGRLESHVMATLDALSALLYKIAVKDWHGRATLVRNFLDHGMNIMRINCAHDSAEEWLCMVENLRAAQRKQASPFFTAVAQLLEFVPGQFTANVAGVLSRK